MDKNQFVLRHSSLNRLLKLSIMTLFVGCVPVYLQIEIKIWILHQTMKEVSQFVVFLAETLG